MCLLTSCPALQVLNIVYLAPGATKGGFFPEGISGPIGTLSRAELDAALAALAAKLSGDAMMPAMGPMMGGPYMGDNAPMMAMPSPMMSGGEPPVMGDDGQLYCPPCGGAEPPVAVGGEGDVGGYDGAMPPMAVGGEDMGGYGGIAPESAVAPEDDFAPLAGPDMMAPAPMGGYGAMPPMDVGAYGPGSAVGGEGGYGYGSRAIAPTMAPLSGPDFSPGSGAGAMPPVAVAPEAVAPEAATADRSAAESSPEGDGVGQQEVEQLAQPQNGATGAALAAALAAPALLALLL